MLCQPQGYSKVNQLYMHIYPHFSKILFPYRSLQRIEQSSLGFPGGSVVKNPPASAGDMGSVPELGRSLGEGNSHPLQYSCLGTLMDRGAWQAVVHGVIKESDTTQRLNNNNPVISSRFKQITGKLYFFKLGNKIFTAQQKENQVKVYLVNGWTGQSKQGPREWLDSPSWNRQSGEVPSINEPLRKSRNSLSQRDLKLPKKPNVTWSFGTGPKTGLGHKEQKESLFTRTMLNHFPR